MTTTHSQMPNGTTHASSGVNHRLQQQQQQQQHDRQTLQHSATMRSSYNRKTVKNTTQWHPVAPLAVFLASCASVTAFSSPSVTHHTQRPLGWVSTTRTSQALMFQRIRSGDSTASTRIPTSNMPTLLLRQRIPTHNRQIFPSNNRHNSILSLHGVSPKTQLANLMKKDQLPSENEVPGPIENRSTRARWIGWMQAGTPRGADEVKMREASELGGVPRSDRYSSRDWFHNTLNLPSSDILRAVRGPVVAMTSWATFLAILHQRLLYTNPIAASRMCIPSTLHSLMVSALGLLLVFRTNSAYQRFVEGRKIWGEIVNSARDLYRYIMMYEKEIGMDKRRRIQRLLAAFPFLLRHRVRPNLVMHRVDDNLFERDPKNTLLLYQDRALPDNDPEAAAVANEEANTGKSRRKTRPLYWVDKRTLPWRLLPSSALEKCARAQNRPLWVIDRMAHELRTVPDGPDFTNRERLTLISHVDKLSRLIGDCERIHQTAVPLNYARHSLRALTLWLFTLPFALVHDMKLLTGPALFLIAWLLFGVYEIGVAIEDPFQGTLRLSIICDIIRRDVLGDEIIRSTAFDLRKDGYDDEDDDEVKYYDGQNDIAEEKNDDKDETISMSNGADSGKDVNREEEKSDSQEHESKAFE